MRMILRYNRYVPVHTTRPFFPPPSLSLPSLPSLPFPPILITHHSSLITHTLTLSSLIHPSINYDLAIKSAQSSSYVFLNLQYLFPPYPPSSYLPFPFFSSLSFPSLPLSSPLFPSPFPSPLLPPKYKYVKNKRKKVKKKEKVKINILPSACPHSQFRPPYIALLTSLSNANLVQS